MPSFEMAKIECAAVKLGKIRGDQFFCFDHQMGKPCVLARATCCENATSSYSRVGAASIKGMPWGVCQQKLAELPAAQNKRVSAQNEDLLQRFQPGNWLTNSTPYSMGHFVV